MSIINIIEYLTLLKANNNKEWFNDNKAVYNNAKKYFETVVQKLINEIALFDPEIGYPDVKKCIFRINRDIRFSKDKSPYKTNFGGFILKGGRNSGNAGYYLHLSPEGSFIAGGSYMPENETLRNIRMDIVQHIDEFINIVENKDFKKTFGEIEGDKLKNLPKGFPEDFTYPELIKYKSYSVITDLSDEQIKLVEPDFLKLVVDTFKKMTPFIQFLNRAINLN